MITSTVVGRIATITLDAPDSRNAMSFPDTLELAHTVAELGASREVDALVLTGAGTTFSAGADLRMVGDAADIVGYVVDGLTSSIPALAEAMLGSPVPIVAAVNGPAIGGAVGFALLADIAVATRSAYFQLPQVARWGIAPDMGTGYLPARCVGRARALGFSVLGERLSATEAESWGLIWRAVDDDDFADEVGRTAKRLAADPEAVVRARALVDAAPQRTLSDGLAAECVAMGDLVSRPRVLDLLAQLATPQDKGGRP